MRREPIVGFYNNTVCVLVDEENPILYVSLGKWSKFSYEPRSKDIFNEADDLCLDGSTLVYQGWRPNIDSKCKEIVADMFYKHGDKHVDISDIHWLGFEFDDYALAYNSFPQLVDHILDNDYQPEWVLNATESN